jgi:hypothetical protein
MHGCAWGLGSGLGAHRPLHEQELTMSAMNGDKARFHRDRKKKIARRGRKREMLKGLAEQSTMGVGSSGSKSKAVTV